MLKTVLVITALAAAGPAIAAEMVIGSGRARVCYLDAEKERASAIAIRNCTEAIELDNLSRDDRVATHVNRGILESRVGDHVRALADYDRAIALDGNEAEAYLNKAATLFKLEDRWRDAMPLFTLALEKRTKRPELAYFGRGLGHELSGNLKAAYADLKMASTLAPDWPLAPRELARYSIKKRG